MLSPDILLVGSVTHNIQTTVPPKDRSFLGLHYDDFSGESHWIIYNYIKKSDGHRVNAYVDREGFEMRNIKGWHELPPTDF